MRPVLFATACLLACKDKPASQPAAGSGSDIAAVISDGAAAADATPDGAPPSDAGSASDDAGSAAVVPVTADADVAVAVAAPPTVDAHTPPAIAAPPEPAVPVAVDTGGAPGDLDYDAKSTDTELRVAFANHVPRLPAVSADGVWIADYGTDVLRAMRPSPIFVRVFRLDGKGKPERIDIVDLQMAEANADAGDWEANPPPPAVAKVLRERAAAVIARLRGFASLTPVETRGSSKRTAKIGALKLTTTEKTDQKGGLQLVLTDARGKTIQREQIRTYSDGTHPAALEGGGCEYKPHLQGAYLDQAKRRLYIGVTFRWREECTAQEPRFVAWDLPSP